MRSFFYEQVSVGTKAAKWQDSEKQSLGFTAEYLRFHMLTGTGPVEISLDGQNVHAEFGATGYESSVEFKDAETSEIWIRGVGDETIQVTAWS